MNQVVFIGLGSNLDDPLQQVSDALQELSSHLSITSLTSSSLYKSKPVGPQDQDDYINAVARFETSLDPVSLLDTLQAIEQGHDRKRTRRWGPRTLDLDILAYGDQQINTDRLTVPHPEIPNRGFVLVPWAEINPDWVLPGLGSIDTLLSSIDEPWPEKLQ